MNLIVAVDNNWAVGYNGGLLTYLPGDLPYFKEKTMNKVVVMGRKTLESLPKGKPLKGRKNIILTRDKDFTCEDTVVCHSKDEVLDYITRYESDEVFIIGGAEIYNLFLDNCEKAYITKIYGELPADKYITNLDELDNWNITWKSEMKEHEGLKFQWTLYENNKLK
ncbi:dihydrofolate reductase [Vallitalea guaymasensis]|uniref:dihydrofolate reductase n=1 Tax=Vallitalea guaymasensis TaxID=1185412 RepID=UPI000DE31B09|nr:dihydrofolate reductase [Vallitalea guaymasensis]